MPKPILTLVECNVLHNHIQYLIGYINSLSNPNINVVNCIKRPQVPARLSENIALNDLRNGNITLRRGKTPSLFHFGYRKGGYDIEYPPQMIKIEVKATGTDKFQRFRNHAMNSDVVIWIDFDGLRNKPTTMHQTIFVFRTAKVFKNFQHLHEKTISLDDLGKTYKIHPYIAGTII